LPNSSSWPPVLPVEVAHPILFMPPASIAAIIDFILLGRHKMGRLDHAELTLLL